MWSPFQIVPQPLQNAVPQHPVGRDIAVADLRLQLRQQPSHPPLPSRALGSDRLRERLQQAPQLGSLRHGQADLDLAGVGDAVTVAAADVQRANARRLVANEMSNGVRVKLR